MKNEKSEDMLTFEEKQAIIESFPELTRKEVSMKRLNYHFEESAYDKKIVVQHLHPNGNGFVYVADIPGYEADDRGLVNIREATEEELRKIIADSIQALGHEEVEVSVQQTWVNGDNTLELKEEEGYWNVYHGLNLEDSFGDYEEAVTYLKEEQFTLKEE
ncbi:Uncharacterised protein [Sporosarcina pasteurii]|uniref:Uncharacterized protein n=2 Tax=Sporosarcina pasteurii TaxID=1474 RepID=A0A380CHF9_SPOPA|nr:Uncharacterised protein [Sporosarcina pasteurii]